MTTIHNLHKMHNACAHTCMYYVNCRELVRKKAIMAMHHFYKLSPGSVAHLEDDFRRALSDQDPGVMEAALVLFLYMAKVREGEREREITMFMHYFDLCPLLQDNPPQFKDLSSSFTSILQQVISRKLPSDFDYHGVPAPWIQMSLLRYSASHCAEIHVY